MIRSLPGQYAIPMCGIMNSSRAQEALSRGNIREANELSGSPYRIRALVVHGNRLGGKLGFPTANLQLADNHPFLLPMGVYAVKVTVDQTNYDGMANAGVRPTIGGKNLTLEVHLFDFSGDLYGKTIEVCFIDRIRDEKKFDSLEDLVKQLRLDQADAIRLLA
jgi:riboflavin kinase/FMN adenylyltransferase